MSKYNRMKAAAIAAAKQRRTITLNDIQNDLESLILSRNLEAPFEVKQEGGRFLFVLCPIPNKHNFLVRAEPSRKGFMVNVIHDFPIGTEPLIQNAQFLKTRGQIKVRFSAYLDIIQHFIQNYL